MNSSVKNKVGYNYSLGCVDDFYSKLLFIKNNRKVREELSKNSLEVFKKELCTDVIYKEYASHVIDLASS